MATGLAGWVSAARAAQYMHSPGKLLKHQREKGTHTGEWTLKYFLKASVSDVVLEHNIGGLF